MEPSREIEPRENHWLSTADLAGLASINERNARDACKRCYNDDTWRGVKLDVRKVNGKAYQVHAQSLPSDLFTAWISAQPKPHSPVAVAEALPISVDTQPTKLPDANWIEEAKWIEKLILPALAHPSRSRARGSVVHDIFSRQHIGLDGRPRKVAERTLQDWIKKYEVGGFTALVRRRRHEKGARVQLSRRWDNACPLPLSKRTAIKEGIERYIKSLWAEANPGWAKVEHLAATKLMELCIDAGWTDASLEACKLGKHAVERYRKYGIVHTYRKDAKRFYDLHEPRIIRDHAQLLPMEVVVGDVHPLDITYKREDGSTATPRLIAWYDLASHRMFGTLLFLEKGQGVTQADVWASFAAMVQAWGLPERLYLDNGSEYDWAPLIRGFNELSALASSFRRFTAEIATREDLPDTPAGQEGRQSGGIVRARPYNAAAKAIEGAFSVLEKVLSMLPGYIGGDRMKKRVPKLGKQTAPWNDAESLEAAFIEALRFYHGLPQAGNLGGRSPNEALEWHQANDWRALSIPRHALIYALSDTLRVKVQNNGIQVGGERYEGDEFIPLRQQTITVRYAKWATEQVLFLPNSPGLDGARWIDRAQVFHVMDQAGAREQARRSGLMRRHVSAQSSEVDKLDMTAEVARDNAARPSPQGVLFGPEISLGSGVAALVEAGERKGTPAPQVIKTVKSGQSIDKDSGKPINLADLLPMPSPAKPQSQAPQNLADFLPPVQTKVRMGGQQ